MVKGLKSVNLKMIQMYHFRLKWKRYRKDIRYAQIGKTPTFLEWDSHFSSGTPTFYQMVVLNSCLQNPSESSVMASKLWDADLVFIPYLWIGTVSSPVPDP